MAEDRRLEEAAAGRFLTNTLITSPVREIKPTRAPRVTGRGKKGGSFAEFLRACAHLFRKFARAKNRALKQRGVLSFRCGSRRLFLFEIIFRV